MKIGFRLFLVCFLLLSVFTPMLAASGAPKAVWYGFALVTGVPCLLWLEDLVGRACIRLVDLLLKKIRAQPRPVRVISVGEKRLSYALATLLPLLLMLLAYVFDWGSKWYFIALSSGMCGIVATYVMCHNAATDEKSDV